MVEIMEQYEDFLVQTKHASGNTVASYMRDLHQFASYLQELHLPLLEVDGAAISGYMSALHDRGKSAATISRCLASLKSFYNYAVSCGRKDLNPAMNVHVEKAEKKLPQILTGKEVELDRKSVV